MAALKEFHVIFDEEDAGIAPVPTVISGALTSSTEAQASFKNGILTLTKAEAEKVDPKLSGGETSEGLIIEGRVKRAKIVIVKAAAEQEAVDAVRRLVASPGQTNTEKYALVETTGWKEKALN